jgi:hypothetical protein
VLILVDGGKSTASLSGGHSQLEKQYQLSPVTTPRSALAVPTRASPLEAMSTSGRSPLGTSPYSPTEYGDEVSVVESSTGIAGTSVMDANTGSD